MKGVMCNNMCYFSFQNNEKIYSVVLKQWKGALNQIMPELQRLLKNNDQGCSSCI